MNILIITEDHSLANYGVTTVVSQLADELVKRYCDVKIVILTTSLNSVEQDGKVNIERIPPQGIYKIWKGSPKLIFRLKCIINKYKIDVVHIHGIWMAAQWAGLLVSKKLNLPVIISPHGMLLPWLWDGQGVLKKIKKILYFSMFIRPVLPEQIIVHALTSKEAENYSYLFPGRSQTIIPNGITKISSAIKRTPQSIGKNFLFLSRIHPVKGVDILVKAFHKANLGIEWKLYIVGPPEVPDYLAQIKDDIQELGLSSRIDIIGPVFGDNKDTYYKTAWALVLPSRSEGFGMVNLEAAMCGLPSLLTLEAGLENWAESGGLLVKPDIDDLATKLIEAASWSLNERISRGEQAFHYVKQNYSWDVITPKWHNLYQRISVSQA